MPLDRRISVTVSKPGRRNEHGEFVPGTSTTHELWADVTMPDLERQTDEGRTQAQLRRDWRVRYRNDIAGALPSNVVVSDGTLDTDGNEIVFIVQNIGEDTGVRSETRRRFLLIQGQKTI